MNQAKKPQRPYPRSATSEAIPVLFSLPTIQSAAWVGNPESSATQPIPQRTPLPDAKAGPPARTPSAHLINDTQALRYETVILNSAAIEPFETAGPVSVDSVPGPTPAALARRWSNTLANAAICVLVLALCALVLRNSSSTLPSKDSVSSLPSSTSVSAVNSTPTISTSTNGAAAGSSSPEVDWSRTRPYLPDSVTNKTPPASVSSSSPSQESVVGSLSAGDTFASPASANSIPGVVASQTHDVPASSPNTKPANSGTPATGNSIRSNPAPMRVPSLLPTNPEPRASIPANHRPSMPVQGEAWDSSRLQSGPRKPMPSVSISANDVDSMVSHPNAEIHVEAANDRDRNAWDAQSNPLAYSADADSDNAVRLASAMEPVQATQQSANRDAGPSPSVDASNQAAPRNPPFDGPQVESSTLNTRDIIQLRNGQRKGRDFSKINQPSSMAPTKDTTVVFAGGTNAFARPIGASIKTVETENSNSVGTSMPIAPRKKYEPILSADRMHSSGLSPEITPPATPYHPLAAPTMSLPSEVPGSSLLPPTGSTITPNVTGANPPPRAVPYTPMAPVLPDPS
ncbi:MAG: hypothetical protein WCI02_16815 [Planctomycetota bacterium]